MVLALLCLGWPVLLLLYGLAQRFQACVPGLLCERGRNLLGSFRSWSTHLRLITVFDFLDLFLPSMPISYPQQAPDLLHLVIREPSLAAAFGL